jgi:hypothetical protein
LLAALLLLAVVLTRRWDLAAKLLTPDHIAEVRRMTVAACEEAHHRSSSSPLAKRTTLGVSIAVSAEESGSHISLSLPGLQSDLPLLCSLTCRAFPEVGFDGASISRGRVIHFSVPWHVAEVAAPGVNPQVELTLYREIVLRLQNPVPTHGEVSVQTEVRHEPLAERRDPAHPAKSRRPWWFSTNGK